MVLYSVLIALGTRLIVPWRGVLPTGFFMYLGPETIMPLASILAAVVGVVLLLWRRILGFLRKTFRSHRSAVGGESGLEATDAGSPGDPTDEERD